MNQHVPSKPSSKNSKRLHDGLNHVSEKAVIPLCTAQPAITAGKPLGSEKSDYAVPQAYVNLAAAIVSTSGMSLSSKQLGPA